jgi:hypothetical protein
MTAHRRSILTVLLTLLCGLIAPAFAQDGTSADELPFVPISQFGTSGTSYAPSRAVLTAEEEKEFQDYVKSAPLFPRYLFGASRDRAHAAYMTMPAALKQKVSKIWIVSPSKHSASVKGYIRLTPDVPDSVDVKWDYHVALAFSNAEGLQVYDAGIAPGKVLDGEAWFSHILPDPLSFWTLTAERIYFFHPTSAPGSTNKEIWGGSAYEYTGDPATAQTIPNSLARDAVGEAILKNRICEVMKTDAKEPDALLERLKKGEVTVGCEDLKKIFQTQRQAWIDRLR